MDLQEVAADVPREGETGFPIAAVMSGVEDAANAAGFFPVRHIEILVAPFLVLVVVGDAVRPGAGCLHRGVEGNRVCILLRAPPVEHRREIGAADQAFVVTTKRVFMCTAGITSPPPGAPESSMHSQTSLVRENVIPGGH